MGGDDSVFWDIVTVLFVVYGVTHLVITALMAMGVKATYEGPREMNTFGTHFAKRLFRNKTFFFAFLVTIVLMVIYYFAFGI